MGLKLGVALVAESEGLFVSLDPKLHPYALAQIRSYFENDNLKFKLIYPDGSTGLLFMDQNKQFECGVVIPNTSPGWVPSKDQQAALNGSLPNSRFLFNREYQVRGNIPSADLAPPAVHTDEERFRNPKGLWERSVAYLLSQETSPIPIGS